jgi:hypothetical protein
VEPSFVTVMVSSLTGYPPHFVPSSFRGLAVTLCVEPDRPILSPAVPAGKVH